MMGKMKHGTAEMIKHNLSSYYNADKLKNPHPIALYKIRNC
jgi:hypothetical protein